MHKSVCIPLRTAVNQNGPRRVCPKTGSVLFINQSRQSRPNARRALVTLVTGTIDDTDVKKFNTFDMECESTTTVDADVEKTSLQSQN